MITVRYFAGARAAAGRAEEVVAPSDLGGTTLAALVSELGSRHGDGLARVLASASYLVDETAWRDPAAELPPSATVDVLPPFAGG